MVFKNKRVEYGDINGEIIIKKKSKEGHRLQDVFIDTGVLSKGAYMDVIIGTNGVTRLPLMTENYNLIASPSKVVNGYSLFGFLRDLFGGDVFVEGDEDEDITLQVKDINDNAIDISGGSLAFYEVIETGIDKTKLLRSGSENRVIAPFIYHEESVTGNNASIDGTFSLDKVKQMEGLPLVKDGHTIPASMEYHGKALIVDGYFSSSGTLSYAKNYLHLKDMTYEFLSPIEYEGIRVEDSVNNDSTPVQNIAGFSLEEQRYLSMEDYVFAAGHQLSFKADMKGSGTGTSITTQIGTYLIPIMLLVIKG